MKLMMENRFVLIILFTSFFTINCEAQLGKSNYKIGTDFSSYHTYAWHSVMDNISDGTGETDIRYSENIQHIKNTIEKELRRKGLQLIDKSEADILIAFNGDLRKIVVWSSKDNEYYYFEGTQNLKGTLFIDIIDAQKRNLPGGVG